MMPSWVGLDRLHTYMRSILHNIPSYLKSSQRSVDAESQCALWDISSCVISSIPAWGFSRLRSQSCSDRSFLSCTVLIHSKSILGIFSCVDYIAGHARSHLPVYKSGLSQLILPKLQVLFTMPHVSMCQIFSGKLSCSNIFKYWSLS